MKIFLKLLGGVLLILIIVVLTKTLLLKSKQRSYDMVELPEISEEVLIHLGTAITFPTISYGEPLKFDPAPFDSLKVYLSKTYPVTDSLLEKQLINTHTLLYTWKGKDPAQDPVVYLAHQDVVPVDSGSLDQWDEPPFSGKIIDGKLYGRGSLDDKCGVIGILEAVEMLLQEGFTPNRTIYFAFGHDEEVGGLEGAAKVAEYLRELGETPEFVLDEGIPVLEGIIPGLDSPVAMIATAEKGYVSFRLTIQTKGGHSSGPTPENTIGSLALAVRKLEDNQFPYVMNPVLKDQITGLAAEMPFLYKIAGANTWLFGKPLLKALNAHTTTVTTMINGGMKDNVIPTTASAVVNFRIMPGESIGLIRDHIIKTIDDDRISIEKLPFSNEPPAISSTKSKSYEMLDKAIKQVFGDIPVVPAMLSGGTDSKHFDGLAKNIYRFNPVTINPENSNGHHGLNEFTYTDSFKQAVQFYYVFLKNLNEE